MEHVKAGPEWFGEAVFGEAFDAVKYQEMKEDWYEVKDLAELFVQVYEIKRFPKRNSFDAELRRNYVI